MGLKFWDVIRPQNGKVHDMEIMCKELNAAAQELQIRELCFWICVNMVANAIGRCEFRTFRANEETHGNEYYLWNYEPNINQNSTDFLHKLVAQLYSNNTALIINARKNKGRDTLVVADSWDVEPGVTRMNVYKNVVVGDMTFIKSFNEDEVIHLRLNSRDMREVINGIYDSYYRLYDAAVKAYKWTKGRHWKVHVDALSTKAKGWEERFREMVEKQVMPFLQSDGGVLPEFDGYTYTDIGGKASETAGGDTRDIRNLIEDIFDFTARGFLIPAVLVNGKVEATADANTRFLTNCIDPLCDQLQEEITRKRYGYEQWVNGDYIRVDSSSIIHFDMFANAANVEKLVGSGAYTINDVLRAANQATINEAWADEHFMTLNIATMKEATRSLNRKEE